MDFRNIDAVTAEGLKELNRRIKKANIPPCALDESLNIATWNVRDFGKTPRDKASLYYIAAIIDQFDLVALTELRRELGDLEQVMKILGPYWKVVFSDYIADYGGNWERNAFLYDKRMVHFTGLAAEADPSRTKVGTEYVTSDVSFWRAPYMASFRAGNFDFIMMSVHVRWGDTEAARKKELASLAKWVDIRTRDSSVFDKDFILLGDFNIPDLESPLYKAVSQYGLRMPEPLLNAMGSNLSLSMRYDQILHNPRYTNCFSNNGGVLDFTDRETYPEISEGISKLYPHLNLTEKEFTWQLSDHMPLWVQLNTDTESEQLEQVLGNEVDMRSAE